MKYIVDEDAYNIQYKLELQEQIKHYGGVPIDFFTDDKEQICFTCPWCHQQKNVSMYDISVNNTLLRSLNRNEAFEKTLYLEYVNTSDDVYTCLCPSCNTKLKLVEMVWSE